MKSNDPQRPGQAVVPDTAAKGREARTFVFTNDDAGGGDEEKISVDGFKKIIRYLDAQGIKGTFFWLSRARSAGWIPGHERKQWVDVLHWTVERGHDVQLHVSLGYLLGYTSSDEVEQAKFGKWSIEDRLKDSIAIYERVFGEKPIALRPHGDVRFYNFPPNYEADVEKLFEPLVRLGIKHISLPLAMARKVFHVGESGAGSCFPFRHSSGMVCYPWVMEEYTPRRTKKLADSRGAGEPAIAFDQWLAMAKEALERHRKQNTGVGLMLSHWQVMARDWSQTERFYNLLFEYMKKNGCRFKTLKEVIRSEECR